LRELSTADAQYLAAQGIKAGPPTPWVDQNVGTRYLIGNPLQQIMNTTGYGGISEGINDTPRYKILPTTPDSNSPVVIPSSGPALAALLAQLSANEGFYGPGANVELFVFKQPGGAGHTPMMIGHSGLKYAFQTDETAPPDNMGNPRVEVNAHFLMPGE